jgi:hypothetical protein
MSNALSLSGPVILLENKTPFVIGVINSARGACEVPDISTRVSSILDWIKLNTIVGVCISDQNHDEELFYPWLYANFIVIVLSYSANLSLRHEAWIPKKLFNATYHLSRLALLSLLIVFIVE